MGEKNRRRAWAAAAAAALLLTACVSPYGIRSRPDAMTPTDENLTVIGISQVGSESVWRTANTALLQEAFSKENGYFTILDNARQKQENQIKALRSFISQRVDCIIFSPIVEEGWDTVLQEAQEAGVPVILIDRRVDVDPSLYTAWIGSDFRLEGRMAGQALARALIKRNIRRESVRIVVLQGTKGATAAIGRTEGFNEVAGEHENWLILEQVDAEFTTAKGKEEMAALLKKYSDIDVVVAQNDDMAFGALEAIEEAGRTVGEDGDMLMISFDGTRSALELVEQGVITADVECNPNHGYYAERAVRKLMRGEALAQLYFMPEQVFTRQNVSRALKTRGY